MIEILFFLLIINFIHGIGTWKLYSLSGNKSWQSFVPIYNVLILLRIINRPWWWIFIIFMPGINIIILPVIWVELSRSFKKNTYFDTFLSIFTLGFYNYYLNYFSKPIKNLDAPKYVENKKIPFWGIKFWILNIVIAVSLFFLIGL